MPRTAVFCTERNVQGCVTTSWRLPYKIISHHIRQAATGTAEQGLHRTCPTQIATDALLSSIDPMGLGASHACLYDCMSHHNPCPRQPFVSTLKPVRPVVQKAQEAFKVRRKPAVHLPGRVIGIVHEGMDTS